MEANQWGRISGGEVASETERHRMCGEPAPMPLRWGVAEELHSSRLDLSRSQRTFQLPATVSSWERRLVKASTTCVRERTPYGHSMSKRNADLPNAYVWM